LFRGNATPKSQVNITITSDPITASASADDAGNWSYTTDQWLTDGAHQIFLTAEKDGVKSEQSVSDFVFSSTDQSKIALGKTLPDRDIETLLGEIPEPASFSGISTFNKVLILGGIGIGIIVLVIIIILIVNWRKKKARFSFENIENKQKLQKLQIEKEKNNQAGRLNPDQQVGGSEDLDKLIHPNIQSQNLESPEKSIDLSGQAMPPESKQNNEIEIGTLGGGQGGSDSAKINSEKIKALLEKKSNQADKS